MAELLLELFSEEIPARMQARAAEELKRLVGDELAKANLAFGSARAFVTPRRLALVVEGLPLQQPDVTEERKGPRVGSPDKAIEGFLRSAGVASLDQCEQRDTGKGVFWFAIAKRSGGKTEAVLPALLTAAILALPWPKSMRWSGHTLRWVRPLQSVAALFDGQPLAGRVSLDDRAAVEFGTEVRGHRFLAPAPFTASAFAEYQDKLRAAKVILDRQERRTEILRQAEATAAAAGLSMRPDDGLLDEVVGLVEWPVVLIGRIDETFMALPPEVLTTAMRTHQKYFSLLDGKGKLAPRFLVVSNMATADGGAAIVAGNERVLRARLSDARFFWEQDHKVRLEARVPALANIVFHAKLGTVAEKVERVRKLAIELAQHIPGANAGQVDRAAVLAKADLTTGMVGEFPELQGVMGRYYAVDQGEAPAIADAIAEHYAPLGPNDRCPTAPVSVAVALADKIDSLVGFFAAGEKPTGSKDPFALRRAALGVIRLILENRLRLKLREVFRVAVRPYEESESGSVFDVDELMGFLADRLKVALREQGVRHDLIAAVFALGSEDDLVRLLARVEALGRFLATDDGANLLTAYKRASNIVRIEEKRDGAVYEPDPRAELLRQDEERALSAALRPARETTARGLSADDFSGAMATLAQLRRPVDAFFEGVTVNCDEPDLRANRLRLLSLIRATLGTVADFSRIEG